MNSRLQPLVLATLLAIMPLAPALADAADDADAGRVYFERPRDCHYLPLVQRTADLFAAHHQTTLPPASPDDWWLVRRYCTVCVPSKECALLVFEKLGTRPPAALNQSRLLHQLMRGGCSGMGSPVPPLSVVDCPDLYCDDFELYGIYDTKAQCRADTRRVLAD